jgi:hypothetical protein
MRDQHAYRQGPLTVYSDNGWTGLPHGRLRWLITSAHSVWSKFDFLVTDRIVRNPCDYCKAKLGEKLRGLKVCVRITI